MSTIDFELFIYPKLKRIIEKYEGDSQALEYLMFEQTEIDMYKNYPMYFGYVFYIMRNKPVKSD